ncbi:MAG: hypothetical protein KatS3mg013_1021 [Actinomycetota bacterium]|jgi:hypothetical protein|nr:MAG: hypothetical protein KatS3mg013_1021 [Actinomycetota bacterium]
MSSPALPTVVVSSVIRSAYQGESHGGVYLVDLATGAIEQVLDWNDRSISWEGRGGDRGLRGIAFHEGLVYLAASDEIFVYDPSFRRVGSFRNPYLRHCHEIFVRDGRLYATSTGFDAVLEYDLDAGRFVRGYHLRFAPIWRIRRRLELRPRPSFRVFDPNAPDGPVAADTCHINSVTVDEDGIHVAGTGLGTLWTIRGERIEPTARIPYGSHNARPYERGALLNHTRSDRIVQVDRRGRVLRSWPIPRPERDELEHADLPADLARPAFGRGLTLAGDGVLVGGSSPATVTAYALDPPQVLRSVTITKDVRNAVHGLEVWPFDRS